MRNRILNEIIENYDETEFIIADGLDDAVMGVEESTMRIVYSVTKCIEIFMSGGMTESEAMERLNRNVMSSNVGEKAAIWCDDRF